MIGGLDIDLPTFGNRSSVEVAVRAIRQIWPRSVFENTDTGDRYVFFWQIPFGKIDGLFVYRDAAIADAWDDEGAVPSLRNTMIHVIADDETITVVVDERDSEMSEVIAAITSGLRDDIHYIRAEAA